MSREGGGGPRFIPPSLHRRPPKNSSGGHFERLDALGSGGKGLVVDMALWYKYSDKPSGTLRLAYNVYRNLDARIPAPTKAGVEHRLLYLNVKPTWKLPKTDPMYWFQTGVIRVRFTREGKVPDPTAYQTFVLTPWEDTLITHTHWETGELGRGGVWSMRVRGMLKDAVVGTRYAKGFIL